MKTLIALLVLLVSSIAGAQILISSNLLTFTQVNGTNNGNVYYETNITFPKQRLLLHHGGITNNNVLGVSNIIARLQLSIDSSNTNWVTLETYYPSATNAGVSDSILSDFGKVTLPLRVQVVTTNSLGVAVYQQKLQ